LHVLVFLSHGRRKTIHFNITENPSLENIFKPARDIIKKILAAKIINLYIATISKIRDLYGNENSIEKTIYCKLTLTKETIEQPIR
jgi:hypothetical protein